MKTSYYAKQDKNNFKNCIGISIGMKWYKEKLSQAKELCPEWKMVKKGYSYEEYVSLLEKRGLTPKSIYQKYKDKILLCWEKDPTKCHRRFLARWLKEELNIDVREY